MLESRWLEAHLWVANSILSYEPFENWGIDAIGPLPQVTSEKTFIIMGLDYITRLEDVVIITSVTTKEVDKFVFCWFGTPLDRILDSGLGFRGDLVGELMKKLGISHYLSTPNTFNLMVW